MNLTRNQIIEIAETLGFRLDYDQWNVKDKEWMRFELPPHLDEEYLRLIWYKDGDIRAFEEVKRILFQAGQKAKIKQFNEYINPQSWKLI